MKNHKFALLLFSFMFFIRTTIQHGSMIEPPSRTNAWLYDKDFSTCCKHYDYNQMNCGGQNKMWTVNGGKCGICGESWEESKNFEKGGKKYLGKIVRTYRKESVINVTIQITANHKGYFEFRLCNVDGWEGDATEECLNKTLLKIEQTQEDHVYINTNESVVVLSYNLKLPPLFTCNHCVLQWHWVTANYWGKSSDNKECLGCGIYQEHTNGCSDISIKDQSMLTTLTSTSRSTSSTSTTTTTSSSTSLRSTTSKPSTTTSSTSTTTTTTTQTEPTTLQTTTSTTSPNLTLIKSQGCQAKLEFGESSPNVRAAVTKFCDEVCHLKCLDLIDAYEQDLYHNSESQPTPDLLTCLDTCPVLCTCHTARIP